MVEIPVKEVEELDQNGSKVGKEDNLITKRWLSQQRKCWSES